MTAMDWDDLERAWRTLPAAAAPAVEELMRQQQRRWLSALMLWSEIAVGIAGAIVGLWVLLDGAFGEPDFASVVVGGAALIFTAIASASSWWARSLAPVRAEDPVMFALDAAVRRAQIGVRLAIATLWSSAACLLFLALLLVVMETKDRADGYVVVALALALLAAWLGGTIIYLLRRTADLVRLQALRASFGG